MSVTLSLEDVADLTQRVLVAAGTTEGNARFVTDSVVDAERDGIHSHGLFRLPTYHEHAKCGKVDGRAEPTWTEAGTAGLLADARCGFAHPAITPGLDRIINTAKETGVAALAVTNSYNCGVVGHHVERLANAGLIGLGFVNAPASIAPWGGKTPLFGTDPIALACPRPDAPPVVIDQSSSVVARSEVIVHAKNDEPLPEGWALDADGQPTTDAKAGLAGSMVPSGGYKGASMAMLVEIMAAGLSGARFGFQASSFGDNTGGPPRTGQLFVAFAPSLFGGDDFSRRAEDMFQAILGQDGTRLPGTRRIAAREQSARDGVTISQDLYDNLEARAAG